MIVYQFYLQESWHTIDIFIRSIESLPSIRFIKIDYKLQPPRNGTGLIDILCSQEDYEEIFYWLKARNIKSRVVRTPLKEYHNGKEVTK